MLHQDLVDLLRGLLVVGYCPGLPGLVDLDLVPTSDHFPPRLGSLRNHPRSKCPVSGMLDVAFFVL
jgi:hypothetical protein